MAEPNESGRARLDEPALTAEGLSGGRRLTTSASGPIRALDSIRSERTPVDGNEATVATQARKQLYIGGDWRDADGGAVFTVEDPSVDRSLCEVADAAREDAQAAIEAAANVERRWATTAPHTRSEVLWRAAELLQTRADALALLLTLEMGKPVAEARAEILQAAEHFRWFSGEAIRIDGSYRVSGDGDSRLLVMRQPVGPSYFITPWNFPSAMGARKVAPAIAAGCTMVWKPAPQTPLSALALAEILELAGLPAGVVNVIPSSTSREVSEPIISDPRLRKLSFTGSTQTGRNLIAKSADRVLKLSMELGGNAPFLVFDDADLQEAIAGALVAKMRNGGQACIAANRFHVHESIAAEFAATLAARMDSLVVGRGTEPRTQVGPLIDHGLVGRVDELVRDAIGAGAVCLAGGKPRDGVGSFYEPTVLSDVPLSARLMREEIFGPVAAVVSFGSEAEAIATANDTEYGLAAYVYTTDHGRAMRVCEALETGMVGLNQGFVSNAAAPFGGVKQSGLGREGGREGIDEYLETKYVAVAT